MSMSPKCIRGIIIMRWGHNMSQSGRQLPSLTVTAITMAASLGLLCPETLFKHQFFCSHSHCV